jgi:hypothetical protein
MWRALLVMVLLSGATPAAAAETGYREPDHASILSFQWENDVFSGRGTDRHYTNGLRFSLLRGDDQVPGWLLGLSRALPWFPRGGYVRGSWSLGQNLYTPSDISSPDPIPGDRPYAAWLYLGRGLVLENGRVVDIMELSLGVVGPAALGEPMQKGIHEIIDSPPPRGWEHQLPGEPTVQAIWQRKWRRIHERAERGLGVDLMPHLGGALGNVFVYGAAGGTVRFGVDLPSDYGPPRIQPALPGSEFFVPRRRLSAYLFLGGEGRAVLRNLFLDGSTFHSSPSVDRRWLVADLQAGAALQTAGVRLAYTYVVRTEEFVGQDGVDTFGTFTLSIRL